LPSRPEAIRRLITAMPHILAKDPGEKRMPVRLPKAVIVEIDRWARREKIDKRSKAVRALIEKGLADALDE
jgi:hypothetical protein